MASKSLELNHNHLLLIECDTINGQLKHYLSCDMAVLHE